MVYKRKRKSREVIGFTAADCRKTSLKKVNGVWGEAPSKVAGAAAPDNKPLPEGKGLGLGIENLFYCTSQQKLDRKNISLYNKNIKIGQFKLENYTIL